MYLSRLLGVALFGSAGTRVGRFHDLVARLTQADTPIVTGGLVRRGRAELFLPVEQLSRLIPSGAHLSTVQPNLTPFARRAGEVLLGRDVMDSQVIDLRAPRIVRVNDVLIEQEGDEWRVTGVDIGMGALLRRLLPRAVRPRLAARQLAWNELELFAGDVPGGTVSPDHGRLAQLHPADIARIADAAAARQATEIIAALDDDRAADTMEEMIDAKQADVIEQLDPARAADILEHMAPDAAADALAELQPDVVDDVLRHMIPQEAADVHALLTYAKDTAGGLMTTDYVVAPRGLRVAEATAYLRPQIETPEWVYYVYVVEETQERRLAGVLSLRDLMLAEPSQRMEDIMTRLPRYVYPDVPAAQVAQIMSEYNLMALPVTDHEGRLLGIVSVDDALEVILPVDLRRSVPRVFS